MNHSPRLLRTGRRVSIGIVTGLTALVVLAAPAAAHTEAAAVAADSGRTAITFTFEHGCDAAPTTDFRIQLPAGATDVQPRATPPWAATVAPDQVRWTGGSVDGEGSFTVEMVLAQPAGTPLAIPAIQQCPGGLEEAWIQLPDGSGTEPAMPAPTFVVPVNASVATSPSTTTTIATAEATVGPTTPASMAIDEDPITLEGSQQSTGGLVVFVLVVGAIAIGALVLYLRHRGGAAGRSAKP